MINLSDSPSSSYALRMPASTSNLPFLLILSPFAMPLATITHLSFSTFYSIDLNLMMCNCQDFLRIQFCKHIATIHLHFPHLEQSNPITSLEYSLVLDQQEGNPNPNSNSNSDSRSESRSASAPEATLLEEILTLTHEIISLYIATQ